MKLLVAILDKQGPWINRGQARDFQGPRFPDYGDVASRGLAKRGGAQPFRLRL